LLGTLDAGDRRYVGGVGFGVTCRTVAPILDSGQTIARATSPFGEYLECGTVSLEPHVVADVSFLQFGERGLCDPVLRRSV
jgi:hypothetical protein